MYYKLITYGTMRDIHNLWVHILSVGYYIMNYRPVIYGTMRDRQCTVSLHTDHII